MKLKKLFIGLVFASSFLLPPSSFALMPQPSCIFYGQVKDDFGWPLTTGASVIMRRNGEEVTRCEVNGVLCPGVNFILRVPLDDGRGDAYRASAAQSGDRIEIVVLHNGEEKPVMETNSLPAVGAPGSLQAINVTAGTDANKNDIPDFWDEVLVYFSDGALTNIWQVKPYDDLDADGVDNITEYLSGTFAFDALDFFHAEKSEVVNGRFAVKFFGVLGFSYYPQTCQLIAGTPVWSNVPFATSPDGTVQQAPVVGNFDYVTLYMELDKETNNTSHVAAFRVMTGTSPDEASLR